VLRVSAFAVAVAMMGMLQALPAGAYDTTHLIQPGIGIGRVHLGMPLSDAIRVWGVPGPGYSESTGLTFYCWCERNGFDVLRGGPAVIVDPSEIIVAISVINDASYTLPEGIHTHMRAGTFTQIGSSGSEVRAALGDPDRITPMSADTVSWTYPDRGLVIFLHTRVGVREGAAYQIMVVARDLSP
jgi:hypothetical protein